MKTKYFLSLGVLYAVGATTPAMAQRAKMPRLVSTVGDQVKLAVGERVTLPYANVTRIITDDDEVARALFQNGSAILEGSNPGTTTVEVYQTNGTPKVLTVQVADAMSAAPSAPKTTLASSKPTEMTPVSPEPVALPTSNNNAVGITAARSSLTISTSVSPTPGNSSRAVFTITYGNPGPNPIQDVTIRFPLNEQVSFVPGSANPPAQYDAALREVTWNIPIVPAGQVDQKLKLSVEPIERTPTTFASLATIESAGGTAIASNQVTYSTSPTPLLTVFALPDRFLAGKNGPVLLDVKGRENQTAVDRLQSMGVVNGRGPGQFYPSAATQRAEYAVMTLNGLNLRDLRDITQIKFVLGRDSIVNLNIQNAANRTVATLIRNTTFSAGEHTAIWNGRVDTTFAAPGRYTYVCTAKDKRGEVTSLKGILNIVPQTPLNATGVPSFIDVKPSDWYARYLATGEKQGLLFGFPDKTFRPTNPISRIEATAIVVRALGMEDLAKQWNSAKVGFLDYQNIPAWGNGYLNVATTIAKTASGKPILRGTPDNFFKPGDQLRRDEAALIVQRLIDRETTRHITVSGAMVPGATVTINSRAVEADDQGQFAFAIDTNTSALTTVAVIGPQDR